MSSGETVLHIQHLYTHHTQRMVLREERGGERYRQTDRQTETKRHTVRHRQTNRQTETYSQTVKDRQTEHV